MIMKIVNGFIFAVLTAIGFLFTFVITEQTIKTKRIMQQGTQTIENNELEYFIPARYYNEEKLYDELYEQDGYKFRLISYDVALIKATRNSKNEVVYSVEEGMSFFLLNEGKDFPYFAKAKLVLESNKEIEFSLVRVSKLPIYIFTKAENKSGIVNTKDLKTEEEVFDPIVTINIYEDKKEPAVVINTTPIVEEKFILKEPLSTYFEDNKAAPTENFDVVKVTPVFVINTVTPIILVTSLYFLLVAIILFLIVYIKRKKPLGRKAPTKGLEEDIRRIQRR